MWHICNIMKAMLHIQIDKWIVPHKMWKMQCDACYVTISIWQIQYNKCNAKMQYHLCRSFVLSTNGFVLWTTRIKLWHIDICSNKSVLIFSCFVGRSALSTTQGEQQNYQTVCQSSFWQVVVINFNNLRNAIWLQRD